MQDFLRPCNCVHPSEEDCEKCIQESSEDLPVEGQPVETCCCGEKPVAGCCEGTPAPADKPKEA